MRYRSRSRFRSRRSPARSVSKRFWKTRRGLRLSRRAGMFY